jgi:hypothetical protein
MLQKMGHSMKKERVVEPVWVYSHFMTNILLLFQDRIIDASKMDEFFRQYSQLVEEHQIPPDFIFNLDETYLNVGADSSKVVSINGKPSPVKTQGEPVEHITLLFCVSSMGYSMKPLAILPLLTVPTLPIHVLQKFTFSGNSSGWMTGEIFKNWMMTEFVAEVYKLRQLTGTDDPALLILDNHSSRNSLDLNTLWEVHRIKILFIPPHTSHILQPLDLSVNNHFKQLLSSQYKTVQGESRPIQRARLLSETARVLSATLTEHHIRCGWERSGLWPIDPSLVLDTGMVRNVPPEAVAATPPPQSRRGARFNSQIFALGENAPV